MFRYKVTYLLHFHTFNKIVEDKLDISNGTIFYDGEMNRTVYSEKDACDYVRSTHKFGDVEKLFKVPQEVYDSEHGELGATTLKILKCSIG